MVRIRFSDGSTYDQLGEINFVDVTVDRATDTVIAHATMPNPNGRLVDGQLVRVLVAQKRFDPGQDRTRTGRTRSNTAMLA
jgi:multidrug efflux pump subunit AcrA (membrane-fusion protein)